MLEGAKKIGIATIASAGAAVVILVGGGAGAGDANSMVTVIVTLVNRIFEVKWGDPIFIFLIFFLFSSHLYMYINVLFHKQSVDKVINHCISLGIPMECSSSPKGLHIIPRCPPKA